VARTDLGRDQVFDAARFPLVDTDRPYAKRAGVSTPGASQVDNMLKPKLAEKPDDLRACRPGANGVADLTV